MISKPSNEIFVIDIPEIVDFSAKFRYNYHVPNESTVDSGGVPAKFLRRQTSESTDSFIQYVTSRVPRFVVFQFTPLNLTSTGRDADDTVAREITNAENRANRALIKRNLDKIITEDKFSAYECTSIQFSDGEIEQKIKHVVSGSFVAGTISESDRSDLVVKAMKEKLDVFKQSNQLLNDSRLRDIRNQLKNSGRDTIIKNDKYFTKLRSHKINVQINNKIIDDLITKAIVTEGNSSLVNIKRFTTQLQNNARQVISDNHNTDVDYIDVEIQNSSFIPEKKAAKVIGYVIDKTEIIDNAVVQHQPIIIESPNVSSAIDFKVKYGAVYSYSIRAIVKLTSPGINAENNDVAALQLLVSSRPSRKSYVHTVESIPPKPPNDLNFHWNYETDKLNVTWSFPTNPQRDIKRFQVFRRKTTSSPFELLKEFNFDDSDVKYDSKEKIPESKVVNLTSPVTLYVDDDFVKTSKYIYAIAAIDAHGMTSNYSAQFEVWFDQFKNSLEKRLVSHVGAPKPYPNLYLDVDTFVDAIKTRGLRRLKLFFNPECYDVYDDDNNVSTVVSTVDSQADYRLSILNVDNCQNANLSIDIVDNRSKDADTTVYLGKT